MDEIIFFVGGALGAKGHLRRTFPWAENSLDEAWLELRMPGFTYWIEIPYGFVRDPNAPLCPPRDAGRPEFADAMEILGADDRILNWNHVEYDLGRLPDGGRLTLHQSNPFDTSSEIVLGLPAFQRWDLHTPRTGIELREENGAILSGRCISLRLHDHGSRRSDSFLFSRNPRSNDQRGWGTINISVDDESFELILPSSLFRYVHGVTDPYHKATIRD